MSTSAAKRARPHEEEPMPSSEVTPATMRKFYVTNLMDPKTCWGLHRFSGISEESTLAEIRAIMYKRFRLSENFAFFNVTCTPPALIGHPLEPILKIKSVVRVGAQAEISHVFIAFVQTST